MSNDIVVTAQKRRQSINDIGLSITAIGSEALKDRGISDTSDLVKVVSGFTFTPTISGPPVYTLRGVGFYESSLAVAPAVTVYVDEAPLAFPIMTQVSVLDVERVEVLKGPQGTLYGENSTGGAINYILARPTGEFAAGGTASYGHLSPLDLAGYVSGPISDTLRARLSFRAIEGGEWQKSYTRDASLGATRQLSARLLLDWTPTDRLKMSFNFNGWRDNSDFAANQLQAVTCSLPSNCYLNGYPTAPKNARAADWSPEWPMRMHDRFFQTVVRADYEISPEITLTSLTGYQNLKTLKYSDSDATDIQNLDTRTSGKIESFNEELRLSGKTGPVNWVGGGYYAHAKIFDEFYYATRFLSSALVIPGIPAFTSTETPTDTRLNTYALFGNADVKLSPNLSVIAGARYTWSRRAFDGCTRDIDGALAADVNFLQQLFTGQLARPAVKGGCIVLDDNFLPTNVVEQLNQNSLSWRLGLNQKFESGVLLYTSVSKGYKAGSIPAVSSTSVIQFRPVPQESLLAYEVGVKAPLLDRALQVNASAFYYNYKDKQLRGRILDPFFGLLETLVSIPKSRVWGLEGEIIARPMQGLTLSGSVTYLNTRVQRFSGVDINRDVVNFAGAQFPYSPKWQSVGDAQYVWAIGGIKQAFVGASVTQRSASYSTIGVYDDFRIRGYALVDLRAGIESKDDRWKLTVWGKNITNEYYWNGVFQFIDTRFRQAAKPATYGVTLGFNY
ncbi:TonB-dependent receptor [Sphingomonas paeninsulae]|uniref:TonB-dependent receptor n=1 Tax=Sphingomonas paeninsulae TaxID=2319844 RepID=UPI0013CE6D49|nr:TonB-dependent receptor [Sphingomonas paeninsulae]